MAYRRLLVRAHFRKVFCSGFEEERPAGLPQPLSKLALLRSRLGRAVWFARDLVDERNPLADDQSALAQGELGNVTTRPRLGRARLDELALKCLAFTRCSAKAIRPDDFHDVPLFILRKCSTGFLPGKPKECDTAAGGRARAQQRGRIDNALIKNKKYAWGPVLGAIFGGLSRRFRPVRQNAPVALAKSMS